MRWVELHYSKTQVNKAGKLLSKGIGFPLDYDKSLEILNNWRSAHSYPMNTFQSTLRRKLKAIDENALVAQRLKRIPSIIGKLQRQPEMDLARMQDIGGLRAVVSSLQQVRELQENYRKTKFNHAFVKEQDYILQPKASGYRSIHLIYKYKNERVVAYNGLLLELQIRSTIQHAWATAVETMGTYLDQALKASAGSQNWLDFFSLTSSAFSYLESSAPVPKFQHLNQLQTFSRVAKEAKELKVVSILGAYRAITKNVARNKNAFYYLLVLKAQEQVVNVSYYTRNQLPLASARYLEEEKANKDGANTQVVLVSAGSIEALRRAYPNYFLDTHIFLETLQTVMQEVH